MKKIIVNEASICGEYISGESALTLEKKYKVGYKTIYRILERNGIKRRTDRQKTLNAIKQGRKTHTKKWREIAIKQWQGKGNPRWKPIGTKRNNGKGYILIKTRYGWNWEHRLIAEIILKRKLNKWETIHHINGIKDDNRPINLFVMTKTQHKAFHTIDNINKIKGLIRIKLKSNLSKKCLTEPIQTQTSAVRTELT